MPIPLIPFAGAGAISEGAGTILEKKVLRKKKINFKDYQVFSFLSIAIVMIPLLFFFWNINSDAFQLKNILILAFVVLSSIIANLFVFYAMKWEKITEIEPMRLFQPLFVIILALLIYPSERTNHQIIIAALVASLALIFSHIKKHHIQFNKYMISALLGSLFFALELVASNSILQYYSPISFYFIRCSFIFLISFAIFKSKPGSIDKKTWIYVVGIAMIWVFYRILLYFGYVHYGVIFTTLLFILSAVFIYLFAMIFLKEKPTWRNLIAALIILACVGYAFLVYS